MQEIPTPLNVSTQQPPFYRRPVVGWLLVVLLAFALGMVTSYLVWARPLETRALSAEKASATAEQAVAAAQIAQATQSADQAAAQNAGTQGQVNIPKQVKRYDVGIDGNPVLGSAQAPITIVEFSDYQCPYCQQWQQQVLPQLQEKYGDKVRLVYRDFPLYGTHPEAEAAAEAANCAGAQNKYWEYHNLLFSGQNPLGADTYAAYAKNLSLDTTAFQKCLTDHTYLQEVKNDYDVASKIGVRSTPTFFINGLAVVGAQPVDVFEQIIDLELAGKIPQ